MVIRPCGQWHRPVGQSPDAVRLAEVGLDEQRFQHTYVAGTSFNGWMTFRTVYISTRIATTRTLIRLPCELFRRETVDAILEKSIEPEIKTIQGGNEGNFEL